MTLVPSTDLSAAEWIVNSALPWQQLVGFGPGGFEAYVRLRFLPDPAFEGMREAQADPETELSEAAQLQTAISLLAQHTRTPENLLGLLKEKGTSDLARTRVLAEGCSPWQAGIRRSSRTT